MVSSRKTSHNGGKRIGKDVKLQPGDLISEEVIVDVGTNPLHIFGRLPEGHTVSVYRVYKGENECIDVPDIPVMCKDGCSPLMLFNEPNPDCPTGRFIQDDIWLFYQGRYKLVYTSPDGDTEIPDDVYVWCMQDTLVSKIGINLPLCGENACPPINPCEGDPERPIQTGDILEVCENGVLKKVEFVNTNTDTFGTVAVAGNNFTTTNLIPVLTGQRYIVFPDGTTWIHPTDSFGDPTLALTPGTDKFGVSYSTGDKLIVFPDGDEIVINDTLLKDSCGVDLEPATLMRTIAPIFAEVVGSATNYDSVLPGGSSPTLSAVITNDKCVPMTGKIVFEFPTVDAIAGFGIASISQISQYSIVSAFGPFVTSGWDSFDPQPDQNTLHRGKAGNHTELITLPAGGSITVALRTTIQYDDTIQTVSVARTLTAPKIHWELHNTLEV